MPKDKKSIAVELPVKKSIEKAAADYDMTMADIVATAWEVYEPILRGEMFARMDVHLDVPEHLTPFERRKVAELIFLLKNASTQTINAIDLFLAALLERTGKDARNREDSGRVKTPAKRNRRAAKALPEGNGVA